jgi:hypothetical protein
LLDPIANGTDGVAEQLESGNKGDTGLAVNGKFDGAAGASLGIQGNKGDTGTCSWIWTPYTANH